MVTTLSVMVADGNRAVSYEDQCLTVSFNTCAYQHMRCHSWSNSTITIMATITTTGSAIAIMATTVIWSVLWDL